MGFAEAINNRRIVSFVYDGLPRVVIPAALGSHVATGNPTLRGYLVGGATHSGPGVLWRQFTVAKIKGAAATGDTFSDPPPGYRRNDSHLTGIVAQL